MAEESSAWLLARLVDFPGPGDAALRGEVPAGRVGEGGAAHRAPLHGGQAGGAEQVAGGALVDGAIGRGAAHIT